jgi:hypothetical protein
VGVKGNLKMRTSYIASWAAAFVLGCSPLIAGCGSDARVRRSSIDASPLPAQVGGPRHTVYGDYDTDDYDPGHAGEADNDDSSLPKDRDGDSDNRTGSTFDADDSSVLRFGRPASVGDARAISSLLTRYYAAAAAEDGAAACSMVIAPEARSVPENLGRPPGSPYLRGRTCAAVLTKAFKLSHRQLFTYAEELRVAATRLQGNSGVAVLVFRGPPARQMPVEREHGSWRVASLLDLELP